MANALSLNLKLDSKEVIHSKDIINLLINGGWSIVKDEKIILLPLHDDDLFEWTETKISINEFFKLIDEKENFKEIIGVELAWSNTEIGGHILLYSGREFSFEFNINTQYVQKELRIPDFNWYAERIFAILKSKYQIVEYSYEFTY
ncbi:MULTISPECIES: hypothetical protein [unclassified Lacrimispora]|uniref:hypothetical protein n=1 Tax=unclassified Lacrimispora TaxID=2719232 RepID=UPI00376FEAF4